MKRVEIENLKINPFTLINKEWMLIVAGDETAHNCMTASWGSLGELWGHYTATIHIRPQRYTREFVEKQDYFSLCFFDSDRRDVLNFCGSKSGKDFDKAKECGLTVNFDEKAPYYEEAKLVLVCRKLYSQDMKAENFIDKSIIDKAYPAGDFHRNYVGEIVAVLEK